MDPAAPMQHQRHRRYLGNFFQQRQLEPAALTMNRANRDRQGIDTALLYQPLGFVGRCFLHPARLTFATELAELSFHRGSHPVRNFDNIRGPFDIFFQGQMAAVIHHRVITGP